MVSYFLFALLAATGLALPARPGSDNGDFTASKLDVPSTELHDNHQQHEFAESVGKRDEEENERARRLIAKFCWEHVDSCDYMRCKSTLDNSPDPINFTDFFTKNDFKIE